MEWLSAILFVVLGAIGLVALGIIIYLAGPKGDGTGWGGKVE